MGRLTFDRMGHNMSVGLPVDRPPDRLIHSSRDQEVAMVVFEADEGSVLDILPDEVDPADSPPRLCAWVSRIGLVAGGRAIGVGTYDEFQLAVSVNYQGQRATYIAYYYVSPFPDGARSEVLRYSRHVRGYPAKTAWISYGRDLGQYIGCVERPKGKRLATLTVQPESLCCADDIPMMRDPGLLTKLIPSVEHNARPSVCELVQFEQNWAHRAGRSFHGSGTLTFDSPTDIDPLYRLAPTRILSAWHSLVDADVERGRVVKNYLESEVAAR